MQISTATARQILKADLSEEQAARAIQSAAADAAHWAAEAAAGTLPDPDEMSLDWAIDSDLKNAGIDSYGMQRLAFAIATHA